MFLLRILQEHIFMITKHRIGLPFISSIGFYESESEVTQWVLLLFLQ